MTDVTQDHRIVFSELAEIVARALRAHGLRSPDDMVIARTIALAEADGAHSHGLLRLPGYLAALKSLWVNGNAVPEIHIVKPGVVAVDGKNGFAQVSLAAARETFVEQVKSQGIATLAIRDTHHFAALYADVEPLAERGLLAIAMVNSRPRITPEPRVKKVLGTNPVAFACPRQGSYPLVWDQASSIMSQGDVLIARQQGRQLPSGVGLDSALEPTAEPKAVLEGGALLSFGGHKGHNVAILAEILAAAFTGGLFGFEDPSGMRPGATTAIGGMCVIGIDASAVVGNQFVARVEGLFHLLADAGSGRLLGDRRYRAREVALRDGVLLSKAAFENLKLCR